MAVARLSALIFILHAVAVPLQAQRLPGSVIPEHYDLAFDVDLERARFSGTETIRVQLSEPTRRIVLHALQIRFQEVTISAGGTTVRARVTLHQPTQTAALVVPRDIPKGPAEIHIRYTGILNDELRGFYLSKANGRNYAVTQLESTDARRAFPSFDEPAYKATFSVSLTIDEHDTAISNGRLLSDTPGPGRGRHTLTFAASPKMSSYLVAMAVGDFQCLEDSAEGVPIRICATPDKKELGHIAVDAAKQLLGFYNRYYSIKYPFGKLDVVAVPDFAAGAMENTAAIFYREVDLLADEQTASVANRKRIWEVLAHEIAHQWFGNLVTMKWWDDLWLNEGFATWMEKQPLAALKPEWHMDVAALVDSQRAMNLDSLASTRAIHSNVETPAEIEASFDAIAYEKGGSVMRMVEGYLGAEPFRAGVNAYLEKHQYGNATSEDFWTAMTQASGKPIDRILPTFVNQPGVPLLDIALACDNGAATISMTVERLFVDPSMARTTPTSSGWQIPICVKTPARGDAACQVVSGPTAAVAAADRCLPWAFVNGGAQGYFRSSYSTDILRAIAPDLTTRLTPPERLSLLDDEWALVRAGRHTVAGYLTLASGIGGEHVSGVLGNVTAPLALIGEHLTTPRTRPVYEQFVQTLLRPLFNELGVTVAPGEDDDRRALRAVVIAALGEVGNDREVARHAREALDQALAGTTPLDSTAADAIIAVAAKHGDAALYEAMAAASRRATSPSERYRYLYGLARFEDPALVQRGLEFALSAELRSQDAATYLGRFLANPGTRVQAWAFVKQRWKALEPKVTISLGDVRLVQSLQSVCDAGVRDDIRSFFATHRLPAASRAVDQTLERINNCIALKDKQTPVLTEWLSARETR
ncbi:MAG: M1 family peptidase [Luteitalea sp.]|nr:M1 family peptidase [Luteitalea sp.]